MNNNPKKTCLGFIVCTLYCTFLRGKVLNSDKHDPPPPTFYPSSNNLSAVLCREQGSKSLLITELLSIPSAENVAKQWGISREEQDQFSLNSQQQTEAAQKNGHFKEEIVCVTVQMRKGVFAKPKPTLSRFFFFPAPSLPSSLNNNKSLHSMKTYHRILFCVLHQTNLNTPSNKII